jgi:uncharacterized protein (DUF1697 family)
VVKNDPFKDRKEDDSRKLYVYFLSDNPDKSLHASLDAYKSEGEELVFNKRELYFLAPGFGNTKLNNSLIERKLGVTSTARNWATVNKVLAL